MSDGPDDATAKGASRSELGALLVLFLRLGVTAFGGPAAHIAIMQDEVVRRGKWLTEEKFLDMVGAANLIPGPNSTEVAIHIGLERAGWRGWVVAGAAFILPAALITTGLAWAYQRFGTLPQGAGVLYGVKPAVIAIVVQALWSLAPKAAKTRQLSAIGVLAAAAAFLGVNELAVLAVAGCSAVALQRTRRSDASSMFLVGTFGAAAGVGAAPFSLTALFLVFAKVGSILFGSGYVLLAFLRADLVERLHWITEAQLLDAIVVGQITPGPVFTTATFIGYQLGGPAGAAVATAGIFAPAFVFVALSGWLLPRLRRSPRAGAFLDGVNIASLALMAAVTVQLGRAAIVDIPSALFALASAFALLRWKVNSTWLVLGGGLAGALIQWLH